MPSVIFKLGVTLAAAALPLISAEAQSQAQAQAQAQPQTPSQTQTQGQEQASTEADGQAAPIRAGTSKGISTAPLAPPNTADTVVAPASVTAEDRTRGGTRPSYNQQSGSEVIGAFAGGSAEHRSIVPGWPSES